MECLVKLLSKHEYLKFSNNFLTEFFTCNEVSDREWNEYQLQWKKNLFLNKFYSDIQTVSVHKLGMEVCIQMARLLSERLFKTIHEELKISGSFITMVTNRWQGYDTMYQCFFSVILCVCSKFPSFTLTDLHFDHFMSILIF